MNYSIGIILLNSKKQDLFNQFIEDVLPQVVLLSLPKDYYSSLVRNAKKYSLDFDDAYQTRIALSQEIAIATMDKDFLKVKNDISVQFI
ncbi:MAG: hypothetical protein K9G67_10660 [Bacteroidales bacterium]|nr:hypothetical protein [Bacteroidales bacterium]MCF8345161.1 hypothetical protein [Bacteroidales bacterium]MCF8351097.1 hypothetical protein [Bacteroidales bacterium]MCF8376805.1 hypothetical protein [Bacteroidales bacterium]